MIQLCEDGGGEKSRKKGPGVTDVGSIRNRWTKGVEKKVEKNISERKME